MIDHYLCSSDHFITGDRFTQLPCLSSPPLRKINRNQTGSRQVWRCFAVVAITYKVRVNWPPVANRGFPLLGTQSQCGGANPMGFFLNGFHWIQQIQWSMTKSKNGMVTRSITQSASDILPFLVMECPLPLLPLVRYPLRSTTVNRYHPRDSNGNIFFTTTSRNVSVVRYGVSLVTILLLDFVMIHWIQSFRKNSNIRPKSSWKLYENDNKQRRKQMRKVFIQGHKHQRKFWFSFVTCEWAFTLLVSFGNLLIILYQ